MTETGSEGVKTMKTMLKKILLSVIVVLFSAAGSNAIAYGGSAQEVSCYWVPKDATFLTYKCIDENGVDYTSQIDQMADQAGELPVEHKECQGRRTLSMSDDGVASFGCV